MRRDRLPLLIACALGWACTGETPPPSAPVPEEDGVVRPTSISAIDLGARVYAMPAGWDPAAPWHVAVHSDGRIVAGGSNGLFLLGEEIVEIDPRPVCGVLADASLGFVIANDDGLFVYDTELYPSALSDMLDGVEVQSLVRRQGEVWLLTDGGLHALTEGGLSSFPELGGLHSLRTHDGTAFLVAEGAGATTLLRAEGTGLAGQSLSEELDAIGLASPGPQGRIFAVAGDERALYERLEVEGGVAWLPVALSIDAEDTGAVAIDAAIADPVAGALWLTAGESLLRIDSGGAVATITGAAAAAGRLVATTDGAVWMSETDLLVRVGPDSPPPSYEQHVVPWYEDNCASCHEPGGTVATQTRFGDYDGFALLIDTIIEQIDAGYMPAGDQELIGDPDLPRSWRDGGLRP